MTFPCGSFTIFQLNGAILTKIMTKHSYNITAPQFIPQASDFYFVENIDI